jgi:branched-chain amino acid transport system substrate-binding protein
MRMHDITNAEARSRRPLARKLMLVAAMALTLGVAACGGSDNSGGGDTAAAKSDEPIVIGGAIAQSGVMSQFDRPVTQGAQIAIDEINRAGGVDGRRLKWIAADHKSDLNLVQQAALDVLDKGADVVITTHDFDFGSPAAQVANSRGVLALGGAGGMSFGRQGIGPLTFNLYPGNVTEGASMAQFAFDQGYRKPFLMQDLSIQYTKEVCEFVEQQWRDLGGGPIAGKATFQNDDSSFSSQVNAARKAGADSIVLCSYPPGGPALIRQLRAADVNLPIVASGGGMDGTSWLEAVPHLSNYYDVVMAALTGDDPNPERNKLFDEIEARYGARPALAAQALTGYSAIQAVKLAVEANHGSTDGAALAKTLEGFRDQPLMVGPVTYSAQCHIPVGMPMQVRTVEDGTSRFFDTVDPRTVPKSPC